MPVPNQVWCGDITYIWAQGEMALPGRCLDLCARRVVGWALSNKPDADLVIKALDMPYEQRGGPQGLLLHSDQWSQYGSRQFLQRLWRYVGALVLSRAVEKERTRKGIIASTRKAIEKSYFKPKK